MAEEVSHQSKYVKLKKNQAPLEDIEPGELNQPIDVPQLNVHKCNECGQLLPETYRAPADEPWTTGIFGCAEDTESCKLGLFCPCVLYGRNVERLRKNTPWTRPCIFHAVFVEGGLLLAAGTAAMHGIIDPRTIGLIFEGLFFSWCLCGTHAGLIRMLLQQKYHLKSSPCGPGVVHCCMHWCAICQEHREMNAHLSAESMLPVTVVNPPPAQVMINVAGGDTRGSPSTSAS